MGKMKAFEHHCGGYYVAEENEDGFHYAPSGCVCWGHGECYDSAEIALAVYRGELPGGSPDGGDDEGEDEEGEDDDEE